MLGLHLMLVALHGWFTNSIEQLELMTLDATFSVVTDEPFEFEKEPDHIQDFRKIIHPFQGIYQIILQFNKENPERHRFATRWARISTNYAQNRSEICINPKLIIAFPKLRTTQICKKKFSRQL